MRLTRQLVGKLAKTGPSAGGARGTDPAAPRAPTRAGRPSISLGQRLVGRCDPEKCPLTCCFGSGGRLGRHFPTWVQGVIATAGLISRELLAMDKEAPLAPPPPEGRAPHLHRSTLPGLYRLGMRSVSPALSRANDHEQGGEANLSRSCKVVCADQRTQHPARARGRSPVIQNPPGEGDWRAVL